MGVSITYMIRILPVVAAELADDEQVQPLAKDEN
jgi:hypothetical protein